MVEIEVITKRIGGSIGIILPKSIIEKDHIKEEEKIKIEIKKRPLVGEFFGMIGGKKIDTENVMKEVKEGWKEKNYSLTRTR